MSLTFYYAPMSTAAITEQVLEELAVPCERVVLDIQKGDTQKPDFLKLNPNGKVPVLVHDGVAIWESAAITLYLGETFGVEKKLYPAPGPKRGEAMKWIVWSNVTAVEAVGRLMRNTTDWYPKDQQNAKAGEAAKQDIADCLKILNDALRGRAFLLGDFTIVDAHVNCLVDWFRMTKTDLSAYPEIEAWSKRCAARPAYQRVMARSKH